MKKNCKNYFITFLILLILPISEINALSLSDITSKFSSIFSSTVDKNEGATSFRSLLIPFGGRTESLGNAYTGLCDDVSYLRSNPSAGSIQNETQLSLFHNTWIADSNLDSLAYTTRFKKMPNLSIGGYISCFYLPFTEYNIFGDKNASSYYVETISAINASYNFWAGYDFKGLALGATIKTGWRSVPNYTDNDTNMIIKGSGLEQSAFAIMADVGLMMRFNFLKFFASREPNVRIGISAQNLGISITGFGKQIKLDSGLPTLFSAGISVQFLNPLTISIDFTQPVNFLNISSYLLPYIQIGVDVRFTSFLSFLAGLQLKGGKPTITAGLEFELTKIRINFNYSLDLTTSLAPINRFSISTKIMLGDKGRRQVRDKVDKYYKEGLTYYQNADWQNAIDSWNNALKLDKRFDPAILGIESAQYQIDMFKFIEESLLLD